jgi:hypothetical protein
MLEVYKKISFNAFHICMVVFVISLLVNGNFDYIINAINYVINVQAPGFWFIVIDIFLVYIILSNLQFDFGFHVAVKLNL